MKILPRNIAMPFFLMAALTTFSHGMEVDIHDSELPHEMLVAHNSATLVSVKQASDEIVELFRAKEQKI